ncbi:hypothetical protein RRG08_043615 [Elysia crispata]|uniref:Uncharacterized protein n=1 Tax=Elysia crispata TaxID=231223 RepID=A0AAE1DU41_9GAST|nr:hypothetical protein RRG08_043615 [Elysia crispata]
MKADSRTFYCVPERSSEDNSVSHSQPSDPRNTPGWVELRSGASGKSDDTNTRFHLWSAGFRSPKLGTNDTTRPTVTLELDKWQHAIQKIEPTRTLTFLFSPQVIEVLDVGAA